MPAKSLTYLDHLESVSYQKSKISMEEIMGYMQLIHKLPAAALSFSMPSFIVIDYTKNSHILLSGPVKSIIGYQPEDFLQGGLGFVTSLVHKDDFVIFNENVFKSFAGFLKDIPHGEQQNFLFSYNFRIKDKDGNQLKLLQRSSYITSEETGQPLFCYGTVTNITDYKKDNNIVMQVDKCRQREDGFSYENLVTNYFYPNRQDALLTNREKEVLCWIAEGYSIKQLADKLNLTESTITNHRANMMRKTNTKNVAQLIIFGVKNGIL